jgi:hypothetical protein
MEAVRTFKPMSHKVRMSAAVAAINRTRIALPPNRVADTPGQFDRPLSIIRHFSRKVAGIAM